MRFPRSLLPLAIVACQAPLDAATADRFDPPPSYERLWQYAARCSGREDQLGRYRELEFYSVPDPWPCGGGECVGHTDGRRIYLARSYRTHPMVVAHEMVHAVTGIMGHPEVPFTRPCKLTWASYDEFLPPIEDLDP